MLQVKMNIKQFCFLQVLYTVEFIYASYRKLFSFCNLPFFFFFCKGPVNTLSWKNRQTTQQ